jgi:beta-phosphoglucomutase-like phosphatase (HAD superfamily)
LQAEQGDVMATIMPQGELMRRAVTWIDAQRTETGKPVPQLIEQAAMRFNLSPKDADFLTAFFKEQQEADRG